MENASKALLIAGGILLSIIVLTLFMLMVNSLTDYQQQETQTQKQADIISFNNQYAGYMRDDVSGTDILSLINKVVYYNRTKSTAGTGTTDSGASYGSEPITVVIDLKDVNTRKKLARGNNNVLFTGTSFTYTFNQTSSVNDVVTGINYINEIKNSYLPYTPSYFWVPKQYQNQKIKITDGILKALSDNYDSDKSIFDENFNNLEEKEKRERLHEFNLIVGKTFFPLYYRKNGSDKNIEKEKIEDYWEDYFNTNENKVKYKATPINKSLRQLVAYYYEYAQFQRAKFKWVQPPTGQETYSNDGKIRYLKFEFTGEFI